MRQVFLLEWKINVRFPFTLSWWKSTDLGVTPYSLAKEEEQVPNKMFFAEWIFRVKARLTQMKRLTKVSMRKSGEIQKQQISVK